jgi:hypothetical protein
MPRQNALTKAVDFAMKYWYHPSALEPKIEAADTGKK